MSSAPQLPLRSTCSAAHSVSAVVLEPNQIRFSGATPRPASAMVCGACGDSSMTTPRLATFVGAGASNLSDARLVRQQFCQCANRLAATRQLRRHRVCSVDAPCNRSTQLRRAPERRVKGSGLPVADWVCMVTHGNTVSLYGIVNFTFDKSDSLRSMLTLFDLYQSDLIQGSAGLRDEKTNRQAVGPTRRRHTEQLSRPKHRRRSARPCSKQDTAPGYDPGFKRPWERKAPSSCR